MYISRTGRIKVLFTCVIYFQLFFKILIYIKLTKNNGSNKFLMQSEVCGDIRLGRLDNNQIDLLIKSIKLNELDEDLEDLFYSINNMRINAELFGLSNTGKKEKRKSWVH